MEQKQKALNVHKYLNSLKNMALDTHIHMYSKFK